MNEPAFRRTIPKSTLPYPKGLHNRSKYFAWKVISPVHGTGRDLLVNLKIMHHEGRQHYLLGHIVPDRSMKDFLKHLETQQFARHSIALEDDDEVASVRRLVGFKHQYHLRIFKDGEVRGHYEFTPECHPVLHLKKTGQEPRREEILGFLGDWIVPLPPEDPRIFSDSITRVLGRSQF